VIQETEKVDLLIRGGMALTLAEEKEIILNPAIGIKAERILFVEKDDWEGLRQIYAKETIDASGTLIMPGLVNTHTHVPMVAFRGMADDLPLMDWLDRYIFPAEKKYVNREMVYTSARLAVAEMILSGTTTFCDGYFFESAVAEAALECGIRAVPGAGFIDPAFPSPPDLTKQVEIARRFVERWAGRSGLTRPALFCHSPYTCTPETISAVKEVARESGVPFLIHLSETRDEVELTKNLYGMSPVRHLRRLGVLDGNTVAIHAVWVDDEEVEILGDHGVKVSHCPESNMKLASGICPVPKLLERSVTVGLGTDGAASNNDLDMFGEMDKAAKVGKVAGMDPTAVSAKAVLRMATIGGAAVLGMEREIGSLEPGKHADLILVDLKKPHLTPMYNPYSHIVYAASGADVKTAIIAGRVVMADRHLMTLDVEAAMAGVAEIAEAVKKNPSFSRFSP